MKNCFLFLLLVVSLAACGDDEESIEGTYDLVSIESSNCPDSEDNGVITAGGDCSLACIEFTITLEDGKYSFVSKTGILGDVDTETDTGTYTVTGNVIEVCDSDNDCSSTTYVLNDGTLTLTGEEDGCDMKQVFKKQ